MFNSASSLKTPAKADDNQKIRLLEQIRCDLPHYKDMLDFFDPIIKEQERYKQALISGQDICIDEDLVYELRLREGLQLMTKSDIICDSPIINDYFITLLSIIKPQAADKLDAIEHLVSQNKGFCFETMIDFKLRRAQAIPDNIMVEFLIDETLGPLLELYAQELKSRFKFDKWSKHFCPVCGRDPVFALLQEDGKKTLVCSICNFEWEFTRLKCLYCGNEDQKLLSYLSIKNDDMYRIETCDACRCYLKTIDLKNASHEISYDIESIITLHLDIIARNKGYSNIFSPSSATEDPLYQCA
jgi:FdhE protein